MGRTIIQVRGFPLYQNCVAEGFHGGKKSGIPSENNPVFQIDTGIRLAVTFLKGIPNNARDRPALGSTSSRQSIIIIIIPSAVVEINKISEDGGISSATFEFIGQFKGH